MKKKLLLRGVLGFPLGIAIGYAITILLSLIWGQGYYSPCVPALTDAMGSEINAVMVQTALSGLLGTSFAACSVIWEMDNWSILKQTGVYFLITAFVMMPVAYLTNWMEHTVAGALSYFGIFAVIFMIVWMIQYLIWKNKIKRMNSGIQKK
ncbi:MAG: DUF3021 domain-containing protein [Clostridiales bacterium]|nr:DUF3021 domain-containing protein [Clostridiales bacterium]